MSTQLFWAVVGGFLLGVFIRSLTQVGITGCLFLVLLGTAVLAAGYIEKKWRQRIVLSLVFFSCAAGVLRMHTAVLSGDPQLNAVLGKEVTIEGSVTDAPDERESSTIIHVAAKSVTATTTVSVFAKIKVTLPPHALIDYGDIVRVTGKLETPQAFDTTGGRQFDYPLYLAAQGVGYELDFPRIDRFGHEGNPLKAAVYSLRERYVQGIRSALPEPEAGLAAGITVGDKRSVGPELSAAFQRDSLVHMVVLSGYNITVVLSAVAYALHQVSRVVQFSGSIFVVVFFILISGGASSAVRSGLMALVAVLARATHRVYLGQRVLAAVAFGMVLWNPFTLVFDPSFQLSALATLGLILFTPIFAGWFTRVPERFGLREILASTCGTQLMVLPLLLYQNGTLSIVSLPANLLALIPVPLAMAASFIGAVGGMFFGTFAAILALPAYVLLWYIIKVATFFASLPFAAVTIPAFSAGWLFAAYPCLFFIWWKLDGGRIRTE